jgi:hypothetical protein
MSRYPSCFVSKAVARARSATGRLTKIVGHHELRLRGLARRTNGGTGVRQGSDFFVGRFRNIPNPAPSAPARRSPTPLLRALVRGGSGHRRLVARRRHHFGSERSRIALQTPYESREVGDELNHVSPGVRYCTRCKPTRVAAGPIQAAGRSRTRALGRANQNELRP